MRTAFLTFLALLCSLAVTRAQESAWSLLEKGRAHLASNETDKARKCFESAVKRDARCADAWYHLGRLAEERGDPAQAREDYAQVSTEFPLYAAAQTRLGHLALRAGDQEAALGHFRASVEKRATVDAWIEVATVELGLRRYEDAAKSLESAAKLAPEEARITSLRARLCFETGKYAEAETAFARLSSRFPRDSSSAFMLGLARLKQGRSEEAAETFVGVLERDPYHKPSIQALLSLWEGDERRARTVTELKARLQAIANSPNRVREG